MNCCNSQCRKNADTFEKVLCTIDGDFACCPECAKQWRQERDRFFNEIIHDDPLYEQWMHGEIT